MKTLTNAINDDIDGIIKHTSFTSTRIVAFATSSSAQDAGKEIQIIGLGPTGNDLITETITLCSENTELPVQTATNMRSLFSIHLDDPLEDTEVQLYQGGSRGIHRIVIPCDNISDGTTFTLGYYASSSIPENLSRVYTAKNTIVDPYDFLIGATYADTIENLVTAINALDGDSEEGIIYGVGTLPHGMFEAVVRSPSVLELQDYLRGSRIYEVLLQSSDSNVYFSRGGLGGLSSGTQGSLIANIMPLTTDLTVEFETGIPDLSLAAWFPAGAVWTSTWNNISTNGTTFYLAIQGNHTSTDWDVTIDCQFASLTTEPFGHIYPGTSKTVTITDDQINFVTLMAPEAGEQIRFRLMNNNTDAEEIKFFVGMINGK
jgi:hypothetical protein